VATLSPQLVVRRGERVMERRSAWMRVAAELDVAEHQLRLDEPARVVEQSGVTEQTIEPGLQCIRDGVRYRDRSWR
jgi:hypothetical protein